MKLAILEFFKRLNISWQRSYELTLMVLRCILGATFLAIVISDLVECRPFSHYWQVLPDPGGQCRQGYAQLITMAVCNVITDLLLVFFPIPIIIRSKMGKKRKVQLVMLFSLNLFVVGITSYRIPHILRDNGSQQSRSLYASIELLFATAASNALVLGSFVRDRGVKKRKYKYDSVAAGSLERSSASASRRPTIIKHWGSDEDLVRDVGFGVKPDLRERQSSAAEAGLYTPAPLVRLQQNMSNWSFPENQRQSVAQSDDLLLAGYRISPIPNNPSPTPRRVSFFDYGGLLDEPDKNPPRPGALRPSPTYPASVPSRTMTAGSTGLRRGSAALLQDLGGFLTPLGPASRPNRHHTKPKASSLTSKLQPIPQSKEDGSPRPSSPAEEQIERVPTVQPSADPVLMDIGGLLGEDKDKQ